MAPEKIARVAHQVIKAFCESLGDFSQVDWELAPDWQKQSTLHGVKFHLEHPDAEVSATHDTWMQEKIDAGWTYGERKDPVAKTHHCLVPFEQLPQEEQAKDHLFRAVVHALNQ